MQVRSRKAVGVVAVVAAIGATGIAVAAGNKDPEIDGTSAAFEYEVETTAVKACRGGDPNDRLVFQTARGTSESDDEALNGNLTIKAVSLIDEENDRITAGKLFITNPDDPRKRTGTFGGFLTVDREEGDDAPTTFAGPDLAPPSQGDTDAVQGFTLGKASDAIAPETSTRALLGNLSLDLPEDGGSADGQLGTERGAGDDAVLANGFCDTDGDGDDDYHEDDGKFSD
jgi:hypothetical protein